LAGPFPPTLLFRRWLRFGALALLCRRVLFLLLLWRIDCPRIAGGKELCQRIEANEFLLRDEEHSILVAPAFFPGAIVRTAFPLRPSSSLAGHPLPHRATILKSEERLVSPDRRLLALPQVTPIACEH